MTSELLIVLLIVVIVVAIILVSRNRHRVRPVILGLLKISPQASQHKPNEPQQTLTESEPRLMTAAESKAELERLQELIDDRKKIAWDTDISYHLWGLYKSLLRYTNPHSSDRYIQDGEWYDVNILHVSTLNGLNTIEFELKGARYKFVANEEKPGWCEIMKFFSLFLYDDSDRCLIEIPMKMKVNSPGRIYSITTEGPKAFLPGDWINDFINGKRKHQSIRNQEIRAQKHQERLFEIEDLKDRLGISFCTKKVSESHTS